MIVSGGVSGGVPEPGAEGPPPLNLPPNLPPPPNSVHARVFGLLACLEDISPPPSENPGYSPEFVIWVGSISWNFVNDAAACTVLLMHGCQVLSLTFLVLVLIAVRFRSKRNDIEKDPSLSERRHGETTRESSDIICSASPTQSHYNRR